MELNVSGVNPQRASVPIRPENAPAEERAPAKTRSAPSVPDPVGAPAGALAAWFDRNGDGKIDATPSIDGGDAFLSVGKDVAQILDHAQLQSNAPRPHGPVAAAAVYRHYGAADHSVASPKK